MKTIKLISTILIFLSFNYLISKVDWQQCNILNEEQGGLLIYQMKFLGNNTCIATVGRQMAFLNLIKSTDNGKNWTVYYYQNYTLKDTTPIPNPFEVAVCDIINENSVFVAFADDASVIRYYKNPNKQDTFKISHKDDYFTSFKMKNDNFGVLTNGGDVFITKNGWKSYDSINTLKQNFALNAFENGNVSFLTYGNDSSYYGIISSKDFSINYYLIDSDCLSLEQYFINDNIGWVFSRRNSGIGITFCNIIHRTNDGGKTWKKQLDTFNIGFFSPRCIKFKDENHGIAFAQNDLIYETFDGGEHWEASHFPSPNGKGGELYMTIEFTDDMILFGTINNGIWRRPMYKTGIQDYEQVFKTYPNPFVNSFTIQDSNIPNGCYLLKLINQDGKEVYQENIEFNGNKTLNIELPSGLYIWQLSGSKNFSGKIIKNN